MLPKGPFAACSAHACLPANSAQNGIWFAEQLCPPGYMFNLAEYLSLEGDLDASLFLKTLHALANELEASRARVISDETGLQLEIASQFDGEVPFVDFSDHKNPMAAAEAWMRADLEDHQRGLWRVALIRLNACHHLWYHCAHHILLDGYSAGLVARRCAEIYSALLDGQAPPPTQIVSAAMLLEGERGYSASRRAERDRAYWVERLAGLPDPVTLSQGGNRSGGVIMASRQMNMQDSQQLRAFSRRIGVSLPQVMVSAFAGYVHRMTGVEDLVLAMPVHGRLARAERCVAMMNANAVALRFDFSRKISFADLAEQGGQTMMSALRHQKYRFEQVRHDLGFTRADQQVASMAVNFEPFDYALQFGPIDAKVVNLSNGSVDDLTAFIFDRGAHQGLTLTLNANPGLYSQAEIEAHLDRLHLFLCEVMADPDAELRDVAIHLPGEKERIAQWSDGGSRPTGENWLDAFDQQCRNFPERIAVHDGTRRLSYAGLDALSSRMAMALQRRGIGRGAVVALLLERSLLLPAAILALHRLGAAYLPLDPDAPGKRNALILQTADPDLVLLSPGRAGAMTDDQRASMVLDDNMLDEAPAAGAARACFGTGDELAYIIFTSGSTGVPKGVEISHGALWTLLAAMRDAIGLDDTTRWLSVTTIAFDIATLEMLLPLCVGGTVEIAQRPEVLDPDLLNARVESAGVTHLQATPSLWSLALEGAGPQMRGLTKLVGGEPLPGDLARRMVEGGPLFNVYGPTETTIWSSIARITRETAARPHIGHPLAGERIFVLDAFGAPAPVGRIGEIWIGGCGLARGYHRRADLTRDSFRETPFGRLYRTGDLGRWNPDGALEHFGRIDFQIKIRGHRIEAGEVEAAMRQFDGIHAAAVIKAADRDHLLGYFCSDAPVESSALEAHLRGCLPDYMVPQAFMRLPAMPQNANGKLDVKALPAIRQTCDESLASARGPLTPTQRQLLARVREALGREDVGIDDDFFRLGGTSLSAARLIALLRRDHGNRISLATVFGVPNLRRLADEIDRASETDPLGPVLELRKARAGAGTVFCLHPVLGVGWGYASLMSALPEDVGICALQSPGLTEPSHWPDLRGMAQDYVARIRAVQPEGPYILLGWSFGGLVAQEVARQLEGQGARIACLCLLDSFPFHPSNGMIAEDVRVGQALAFLGEAPDPAVRTLDALAERMLSRPEVRSLQAILGEARFTMLRDRLRDVVEANLDLARRHVPACIDAPIIALRAAQGKSAMLDGLLDWQGNPWTHLSRGGARQITLDCGHDDMLGPLSLAAFLPELNAALQCRDPVPSQAACEDVLVAV